MIGIIPILFLIYFSILIYKEKTKTLTLLSDYIEHIEQSVNIGVLISELSQERRDTYQSLIKKEENQHIAIQRKKTDSVINILKQSPDKALANFTSYTFLDLLPHIRSKIDTQQNYSPNAVVQYYSDAIIRLNSLNATIPSSNAFLRPVYQDLIAQKTLAQMITYLGMIRTNIFNALYTKENINQTILNTLGMYKIYKSYETEFFIKASPQSVALYINQKKTTDYKFTRQYIDKLFTTFNFDSTYKADQWWNLSSKTIRVLKKQQTDLWNSVDARMKATYKQDQQSKNVAFIFIIIAIVCVLVFVAYSINHITGLLRELKHAARKISRGGTGVHFKNMPSGVISNLAKSILQIDKNNILLAQAANQIGKGNFDVIVNARSDEDLLGLSIKKMKHDLHKFTAQKDKIQKETEDLVHRRDDFFSIASHELKTPVTSLKAYTQLLLMDATASGDMNAEKMLEKMDTQINKLTSLITNLLETSKVQNGQLDYNKQPFIFQELLAETIAGIKSGPSNPQIIFKGGSDAEIYADRERIGQVINSLLMNAIKYAAQSKEIIIELTRQKDKIICSVHDFGHGIVEDELDRIFERFYRIPGNNLHTFPGLGLGLYMSREIIQKHNGKMWAESEHGKGSTFYFELPVN